MNGYLQSKSPRERAALGLAVFIMALAAVFALLTEPGTARLQRSRAQLASVTATHVHVAGIARRMAGFEEATAAGVRTLPPDATLMSVIDATALKAGITHAVKRLVPRSANEVSVVLEAVPFDELMSWLGDLHSAYGFNIDQFTANPGARGGHVNVSLVLSM